MTEIALPGGVVADIPSNVVELEGVTIHQHKAKIRTIERWRTKAGFAALQASYTPEIQEVENAAWDVLVSRMLDYAAGEQLDLLGRIVGEARNGRSDPNYRVRLRARIAINSSLGRPKDIVAVLKLLDPAPALITDLGNASMRVEFLAPLTGLATATEIAGIVGEARAAGIGAHVVMPTDANNFRFGSTTDPLRKFTVAEMASVNALGAATLNIPIAAGGSATPVAGCRLFLQLAQEAADPATISTPSGWTLVSNRPLNAPIPGTGRHYLWTKIAIGTETGTVDIAVGAGAGRSIARVYHVTARSLGVGAVNAIESGTAGTAIPSPALTGFPFWGLCFVAFDSGGGISSFTSGTPIGWQHQAVATAGSAAGGIGISFHYLSKDAADAGTGDTSTLTDAANWSVLAFKVGERVLTHFNFAKLADGRNA
jgi:hypothetical protein